MFLELVCVCVWGGGSIGVTENAIKRKHNFLLESDIISRDRQSLSLLCTSTKDKNLYELGV